MLMHWIRTGPPWDSGQPQLSLAPHYPTWLCTSNRTIPDVLPCAARLHEAHATRGDVYRHGPNFIGSCPSSQHRFEPVFQRLKLAAHDANVLRRRDAERNTIARDSRDNNRDQIPDLNLLACFSTE